MSPRERSRGRGQSCIKLLLWQKRAAPTYKVGVTLSPRYLPIPQKSTEYVCYEPTTRRRSVARSVLLSRESHQLRNRARPRQNDLTCATWSNINSPRADTNSSRPRPSPLIIPSTPRLSIIARVPLCSTLDSPRVKPSPRDLLARGTPSEGRVMSASSLMLGLVRWCHCPAQCPATWVRSTLARRRLGACHPLSRPWLLQERREGAIAVALGGDARRLPGSEWFLGSAERRDHPKIFQCSFGLKTTATHPRSRPLAQTPGRGDIAANLAAITTSKFSRQMVPTPVRRLRPFKPPFNMSAAWHCSLALACPPFARAHLRRRPARSTRPTKNCAGHRGDPVTRLRGFLLENGMPPHAWDTLVNDVRAELRSALLEAQAMPNPDPDAATICLF